MTVSRQIEKSILNRKKGQVFFVSDFEKFGNYDTVRKTLQRLVNKKLLIRLGTGIYYYPKTDKLLGVLYPSIETIALAIAKRDKARIIPAGNYALFLLGLSQQIPLNVVFLTDGSARKINLNNRKIIFKRTSPKNLTPKNKLSNLIIQALKSIGKDNVNKEHLHIIEQQIRKSKELEIIKKDINLAPVWIKKIINEIIVNIQNELA